MQIRPFKESDAKAISKIMHENTAKYNYDGEETVKALQANSTPERIVEKSKQRHYFVAEENGKIFGIGGYQDNELKTFFVNPEAHGKGVGRALAEHAMGKIREAGYKEMQVQSSEHAEKFYEKFGFKKEWKKQIPYAGAMLTVIFMRRKNDNKTRP